MLVLTLAHRWPFYLPASLQDSGANTYGNAAVASERPYSPRTKTRRQARGSPELKMPSFGLCLAKTLHNRRINDLEAHLRRIFDVRILE